MQRHQLPLTHPDYLFRPSQNPYSLKLRNLRERGEPVHLDTDAESLRGKWKDAFRRPVRKLHVEIGCNGAHWIAVQAQKHPDDGFVGVDWKFKPIFRGHERMSKMGLDNLILVRSHAGRLPYLFGPREIDRLYLFFPDPWPKTSQAKHRLIQTEWLRSIAPLLRVDGEFWLKTDHVDYFEQMRQVISECSEWSVETSTQDLHSGHPAPLKLEIPEITLFEKIHLRDGKKIGSLRLRPQV